MACTVRQSLFTRSTVQSRRALAVATLSDLVEQAAGQGDSVAIAILEESSRELARAIAAVYPRLGSSTVPLVITGGTILHGRYLKQAFNRACEAQKFNIYSDPLRRRTGKGCSES